MAWTYNGYRIYTQEYGVSGKQIIARLQPLVGGTIKQIFGYDSSIIKLTAKVVGQANVDNLEALYKTGSAYALVGPEGALGSWELASFDAKRDNTVYQTIDPLQDCDEPVFTVSLELW